MNCEQANKIDIVDFLARNGFHPAKPPKGPVYWYHSPLRTERTPSFKVDRSRNSWIDFGTGQGGSLIDLGILLLRCTVAELLGKLDGLSGVPLRIVQPPVTPVRREPQIRILNTSPISSASLIHYLHYRAIPLELAHQYLEEVTFALHGKTYYCLGCRNNSGGYELRNSYFKASSMPKDILLIKGSEKRLAVFEGFFNFLSFAAHMQNLGQPLPNVLVLNSTSFFERSIPLMATYESVDLYLDQDTNGQVCTNLLCEGKPSNGIYNDKSTLYKNHNDYNNWWMATSPKRRPHPPGSKKHRISA